jgi:formamidopyrimidine-DNA glycosylase
MPELPELETYRRDLSDSPLLGSRILSAQISWERTVLPMSTAEFQKRIVQRLVKELARHGKYLFLELDHGCVVVHLRMTGRLLFVSTDVSVLDYERLRLDLSEDRSLVFIDPRKFGRVTWVESPQLLIQRLGPDAFKELPPPQRIAERFSTTRRCIKAVLLDQSVLAGLGNIYVDEALWSARIHPSRPACGLRRDEVQALHSAIGQVLEKGVKYRGCSLGGNIGNYRGLGGRRGTMQKHLQVFQRQGSPCPRCAHVIQRIVVSQRGTHVCTHCQQL